MLELLNHFGEIDLRMNIDFFMGECGGMVGLVKCIKDLFRNF